eukprot:c12609_g1_i1.p1 GENE.c12609_g1_i1~~c12609_g1_i1.p1  ORF type:complete len:525 (-),score=89.16 c12609_g1_i1:203-1777(-)
MSTKYEEIRQKNIKRNEEFLRKLGPVPSIKKEAPKKAPASPKKRTAPAKTVIPPRKSLRVLGLDPNGATAMQQICSEAKRRKELEELEAKKRARIKGEIPLVVAVDLDKSESEDAQDDVGADDSDDASTSQASKHSQPSQPAQPDIPLSVESCVQALTNENKNHVNHPSSNLAKPDNYLKLVVPEWGVVKAVPHRIYSLSWHPTKQRLIAFAGDKWGHLGIFNAGDASRDASDISEARDADFCTLRPHKKPVTALHVDPTNWNHLYTASYDGTLRRFDFVKQIFEEVYHDPSEGPEGGVQICAMSHDATHSFIWLGDESGSMHAIDPRSRGCVLTHVAHDRKIYSVHVDPTNSNYLVSSSLDGTLKVWDCRVSSSRVSSKAASNVPAKPRTIFSFAVGASVNAVAVSPDGQRLVAQSKDNLLRVWNSPISHLTQTPDHMIRHNNETGRWVTNFRTVWDPKRSNVFMLGSMQKAFDVFDASKGKLVGSLTSERVTAIPALNVAHPALEACVSGNSSGRLSVWLLP